MKRRRPPGVLSCGLLLVGVSFSVLAWGLADAVERLRRRLRGAA